MSTAPHTDDIAVDRFAAAMKAKLAKKRADGRGGWEMCPIGELRRMLHEHLNKGDPVDVANFCMMLWNVQSAALSANQEGKST